MKRPELESKLIAAYLQGFEDKDKVSKLIRYDRQTMAEAYAKQVQKDLIAGVVKSYCKCSEPKPNYPELLWCKYCGDWIPE